MTEGFFTADGEPAIRLRVHGPVRARALQAVIDTGFTGELTLPPDLISALRLSFRTQEEVVLGDGTVRSVPLHVASVRFAGRNRRVLVGEAQTVPLVGTDLLRGFSLQIDFWEGGRVQIHERTE